MIYSIIFKEITFHPESSISGQVQSGFATATWKLNKIVIFEKMPDKMP